MDLYVLILSQADTNAELLLDGQWELDADLRQLQEDEQAVLIERAQEAARLQREKEDAEARVRAEAFRTEEAEKRKGAVLFGARVG
jgi:hypothetical protein